MGSTVVAGGAEVEEGVVEVQEDTAWNMAITCMLLDALPPTFYLLHSANI